MKITQQQLVVVAVVVVYPPMLLPQCPSLVSLLLWSFMARLPLPPMTAAKCSRNASLSLSSTPIAHNPLSLPRRICLPVLSTEDKTKRDKRESSREKIVTILFVVLQNRLCRTDASVPMARTRRSSCRTQLSRDWISLLLLAYLRS
jgi:hypothetical protein